MLNLYFRHHRNRIRLGWWFLRGGFLIIFAMAAFFQLGVMSDPLKWWRGNQSKVYRSQLVENRAPSWLTESYQLHSFATGNFNGEDLEADQFGTSMATDRDWLFVGASHDGRKSPLNGWAYSFCFSSEADKGKGRWLPHDNMVPQAILPNSLYGGDIAIAEQTLMISAAGIKPPHQALGVGGVYVFEQENGSDKWAVQSILRPQNLTLKAKALQPRHHKNRGFGAKLSLDHKWLAVRTAFDPLGKNSWGKLSLFQRRKDGKWHLQQQLPEKEDHTNIKRYGLNALLKKDLLAVKSELLDGSWRCDLLSWNAHSERWELTDQVHETHLEGVPLESLPFADEQVVVQHSALDGSLLWARAGTYKWKRHLLKAPHLRIARNIFAFHPHYGVLLGSSDPTDRSSLIHGLFYPFLDDGSLAAQPLHLVPTLWEDFSSHQGLITDQGDILLAHPRVSANRYEDGVIFVYRKADWSQHLEQIRIPLTNGRASSEKTTIESK